VAFTSVVGGGFLAEPTPKTRETATEKRAYWRVGRRIDRFFETSPVLQV